MSCRVDSVFKCAFEAAAQKNGLSNGDYLVELYAEHEGALGEIRNLQEACRILDAENQKLKAFQTPQEPAQPLSSPSGEQQPH